MRSSVPFIIASLGGSSKWILSQEAQEAHQSHFFLNFGVISVLMRLNEGRKG